MTACTQGPEQAQEQGVKGVLPRGWQGKASLPSTGPRSEPSQSVLLGLPGHLGGQAPPTLKDVDLGAEGHQRPLVGSEGASGAWVM